jgi:hypothetical protein
MDGAVFDLMFAFCEPLLNLLASVSVLSFESVGLDNLVNAQLDLAAQYGVQRLSVPDSASVVFTPAFGMIAASCRR